jgi:alkanesulfonate monooxygenase SsuD/methylene tetrahydromethanopterin reductase-like flavin-dependent oxidoreductase (luciferase family)
VLLRDYDVELSVAPVQRPHPPLWYASSNTRSAQWAAANDVNFVGRWAGGSFTPAAQAYWQTWQARQEGQTRRQPPRVGIAAHVYIGATDTEAVERFRKAGAIHFEHLLSLWHKNGNHTFDFMADLDAGMTSGGALVGTAQTVRDLLTEQVGQAPVNYFEATLAFGDLTPEEAHANLGAFAETVMPAVREAAARRQPALPAG